MQGMNRGVAVVFFVILSLILLLGASYFTVERFFTTTTPIGMDGESFIALNQTSARARISNPKKNASLYFHFTANQRAKLERLIHAKGGASVLATIEMLEDEKKQFSVDDSAFEFGLLYDRGTPDKPEVAPGRHIVSGEFSALKSQGTPVFSILLCVFDGEELPSGFFMHGLYPYAITDVKFSDIRVGYDVSGPVPLYAFHSGGGDIPDLRRASYDFTSCAPFFPASNSSRGVFPKITVSLKPTADIGTWDAQKKLVFHYSGQELTLRRSLSQHTVTLQLSAMDVPYGALDFGLSDDVCAMMLTPNHASDYAAVQNRVLKPFVADLGLALTWPKSRWRSADFELFEWEAVPHVLVFDFADYETQSLYLTRLAYFVEKAGYKGKLVSDEFARMNHGYNAHDYRDQSLADFFTKASVDHFKLNAQEYLLRDILLQNGVIVDNGDGTYRAGLGAVISISRESADYLRRQLLAHESWHGIFFTDESFRNEVSSLYQNFDKTSMEFIKVYWETQNGLGYDRTDEYLMRNEFMAYIMQQPLSEIGKYFVGLANRKSVNEIEGDLAAYIRQTRGSAFAGAGEALNRWAFEHYGLAAGRVQLISK